MRLISQKHQLNVEIKDDAVTVLVVENQRELATILAELCGESIGEPSDFVLSDCKGELSIEKDLQFVYNPFVLDLNDRKIITRLYKELEEISNDNYYEGLSNANSVIINYIDELCNSVPYPITYNLEVTASGFFKLYDVKLENEGSSLLERIINYIRTYRRITGIEAFTFLNLKALLTHEELEMLYEMACYEHLQLLLIESTYRDSLDIENTTIIDQDLCKIEI